MANPSQLFLLADHVKLSLLERQRAVSLNLDASAQNATIARSLETLREGVEALEQSDSPDQTEQARSLRTQYQSLQTQFSSDSRPASDTTATTTNTVSILQPNDPSLRDDFAHARSTPRQPSSSLKRQSLSPNAKAVRFRDNPSADQEEDEDEAATRAALFPYRDNPSPPPIDQSQLSNQQIHQYHQSVLQEQDDQLDRLGESIGRQRELGARIGEELDEHVMMLEDVEAHVDRHQGRLDGARHRIGRIARKASDNKQITTIIVLIVILVLLIIVLKR